MLLLSLFCVALILFVAHPRDKNEAKQAALVIVRIVKDNAYILWDKLHGIEPYYIEQSEEDTLDFGEDPIEVGIEGIFESDKTVRAKPKVDVKK